MNRITFTIILLVAASLQLFAQSRSIAKVDSLLTAMTSNDAFSGAVLIADHSHVLLKKGYGYADRDHRVMNTADTRFDLSSGSKVFTGTAIAYLAKKGELKFTDTIGNYIKGLPKGNVITIQQLLTHSAGFNEFTKAAGFSYAHVNNCSDVIPFMRSMPLRYTPGDSSLCSTGDLIILGAVIEKITGMDFQDYIKSAFIRPLRLKDTRFTPYWTLDDSQRQYAIGYHKDSVGIAKDDYHYNYGFIPLSAGGAWSSVTDLYKFDKAVFSGKIIDLQYPERTMNNNKLLGRNTHFKYGWTVNDTTGAYRSISHADDNSGWLSLNEVYPQHGYTVIILSNLGSIDIKQLSTQIEQMLFHKA